MLNWLLGKSGLADSKKAAAPPAKADDRRSVAASTGPVADKPTLVIVNTPTSRPRLDSTELQTLADLPDFQPLLRSSLSPGDHDAVASLDAQSAFALAQRYESHMRQCADAVSFDQNALCVRIKEIDFAIKVLSDRMSERQKLMAKYAEQMQKTQDLSRSLNKLSMSLRQTVSLMDSLNDLLPPQDRLEKLELSPRLPQTPVATSNLAEAGAEAAEASAAVSESLPATT